MTVYEELKARGFEPNVYGYWKLYDFEERTFKVFDDAEEALNFLIERDGLLNIDANSN